MCLNFGEIGQSLSCQGFGSPLKPQHTQPSNHIFLPQSSIAALGFGRCLGLSRWRVFLGYGSGCQMLSKNVVTACGSKLVSSRGCEVGKKRSLQKMLPNIRLRDMVRRKVYELHATNMLLQQLCGAHFVLRDIKRVLYVKIFCPAQAEADLFRTITCGNLFRTSFFGTLLDESLQLHIHSQVKVVGCAVRGGAEPMEKTSGQCSSGAPTRWRCCRRPPE